MIIKNKKDKQRIAKFLASSGVASRRESEKIILDKRVEVN
ncbi:MAG: S4 domain-containing protein, partial [Pseudomonadota bacterium]|nr:S4 domain-containing protein [Pseudomonadota bacterium]